MPFAVQCVSCHGRLRVTDEAIVGTIVACPRCGSMVQIIEPASQQSETPNAEPERLIAGDEEVDSQEMTRDEIVAGSLRDPTANEPRSDSATLIAPPVTDQAAVQETDWGNERNPQDWIPEPAQQSRQRLLIGAISVGAIIVLGILAIWLFSGPDESSTTRVVVAADTSTTAEPAPEPSDVNESDMTEEILTELDSLPIESPPDELTDPLATEEPSAAPKQPVQLENSDIAKANIPTDLMPVDPLRVDDASTDQNANDARVVRNDDEPTVVDPLMGLPPELEAFTRLLDVPGDAPDAPVIGPADANIEELRVDQAADAMIDPMLLATPPPVVNVDNALKFRVAIQSDGYPFSDFLLLCSEVTQVPMQVDWVTLDLAGVSFTQKVKDSKPGWKSIGDLLKTIAVDTGLVLEQKPTHLLWTLEAKDLQQRLVAVLDTSDFGTEKASAEKLVDDFVKATNWDPRETTGLQALVTDAMRTARDLPVKLNSVTREHLTVQAKCLDPAARPQEDFNDHWPLIELGESGAQLDTAITLAGFLRRTARLNQSTCIVNWQDARDRRLAPGQLVMPFAGDPAGTMLQKTLGPLGLNARQASDGVWWVGTGATYDRMPLLVIGDALGPKREAILERIGTAARQANADLLIQHDPVSDRYLSLMPRFLYRQLPTILKPF